MHVYTMLNDQCVFKSTYFLQELICIDFLCANKVYFYEGLYSHRFVKNLQSLFLISLACSSFQKVRASFLQVIKMRINKARINFEYCSISFNNILGRLVLFDRKNLEIKRFYEISLNRFLNRGVICKFSSCTYSFIGLILQEYMKERTENMGNMSNNEKEESLDIDKNSDKISSKENLQKQNLSSCKVMEQSKESSHKNIAPMQTPASSSENSISIPSKFPAQFQSNAFINFDDSSETTSENDPVGNLPSKPGLTAFIKAKSVEPKSSKNTLSLCEEGADKVNILIDKKISNEIRLVTGEPPNQGPEKSNMKPMVINSKRKMYHTSKSNVFSMVNKEINEKDLRDYKQIIPQPSTTIKINKKQGKKPVKIQLRKNSLSIPKFEPGDISSGLSDIKKSYIPDFGYKNQLEFTRQQGWEIVLDFISKYPRREKTANTISDLLQQKEMMKERRKEVVKNKSFIRFINQPEDRKSNYPIIERMIDIREDFENFYSEFVEFSREFFILKGRIKAHHQQKVKRRVKKLLEWNDMHASKKNNIGDSTHILSIISANAPPRDSSSESSVNTKRKKIMQIEHQMSRKFDEYYFKHKKVPIKFPTKRNLTNQALSSNKSILKMESEMWDDENSNKESEFGSSSGQDNPRNSPVKKMKETIKSPPKKKIFSQKITINPLKIYRRDFKQDTLEPFLAAQSAYMKNLVQNFQRMIALLKTQNCPKKSTENTQKDQDKVGQHTNDIKISELINSFSVSRLEGSIQSFMNQTVQKLNEIFGERQSELKYFKENLSRLLSSYKTINSPKQVFSQRRKRRCRKVEISRNFGNQYQAIKMKPSLMSQRIRNFVKLNFSKEENLRRKIKKVKRIYCNDYLSKTSARRKRNIMYKKDLRSNLFTPPSTRHQTMTPFTAMSKEEHGSKKMVHQYISEYEEISPKMSTIKKSCAKDFRFPASRNIKNRGCQNYFSPKNDGTNQESFLFKSK
ncbi:unnamed protein product [Moneuplotes crassus]|uniref:Uncharacterized protein n=1 Tax=Euplotes crassus TaxID=5936 RepID=A0AAD1XA68_EUPCR|nr:unnamed protein product [Moneuplotes crassus]